MGQDYVAATTGLSSLQGIEVTHLFLAKDRRESKHHGEKQIRHSPVRQAVRIITKKLLRDSCLPFVHK